MIYHFSYEHWVSTPIGLVFQLFADPENLPRIMPPKQQARIEHVELVPPSPHGDGEQDETLAGTGSELLMSFRAVPWHRARILWLARIAEFQWNSFYVDVQVEGPMKSWTHRHEFERASRDGRDGTLIRDLIAYDPGFGFLGAIADAFFIRHALRTTFEYRQAAVERLLLPPQVSDQLRKVGEQLRRLQPR